MSTDVVKVLSMNGLGELPRGRLRVAGAFRHALVLSTLPTGTRPSHQCLFSIVTSMKPLVPYGLKADAREFPEVAAGTEVVFDGERFYFPGFDFDCRDAVETDLRASPAFREDPEGLQRCLAAARTLLRVKAPWEGVRSIDPALDEKSLVELLLGKGPGLTPSGDDFLCGCLWAYAVVGDACFDRLAEVVVAHAGETTPVSRGFLMSAASGSFVEALKMAEGEPLEGLGWLLAQGGSSGADVLAGVVHGLTVVNS